MADYSKQNCHQADMIFVPDELEWLSKQPQSLYVKLCMPLLFGGVNSTNQVKGFLNRAVGCYIQVQILWEWESFF